MGNHFDHLQSRVFKTAGRFFGTSAVWTPSDGGDEITGDILFNDPYDKEELGGMLPYDKPDPRMEWEKGTLPGLFEAVKARKLETVTINGLTYQVQSVRSKADGKTYEANLQVDE